MLRIDGLWRYPVKSLAGERLDVAELTANGIPGDRIVHVRGPAGVRTSRRQHRMLGLAGTLGADASLAAYDGVDRFDILPLLVATDGAVAAFGRDIRRLRPNILIGGVDGMDERSWEGAELHIGNAIVRLDSLRGRCPMTTVDPDTLERDPEVLRDIGRRFGGKLALNAEVMRPGEVRVGDTVTLVRDGKDSANR